MTRSKASVTRPRCLQLPRLWLTVALLLSAVVIFLSLKSHPPLPPGPLGWDKLQHGLAYFGLAAAWCQAIASRRHAAVFVGLVLLGIAIEVLQGWGGVRHREWLDVVANTVGIVTGIGLFHLLLAVPLGWLDDVLAQWVTRG